MSNAATAGGDTRARVLQPQVAALLAAKDPELASAYGMAPAST